MTLALVPHKADRDRVSIWAAVAGTARRPGDRRLTAEQGQQAVGPAAEWKVIDVNGDLPPEYRTTWTQAVEKRGPMATLTPGHVSGSGPYVEIGDLRCYYY